MTLTQRLGLTHMRPRDPKQPHRAASPLELFFDLVFVVAVSLASAQLHHFESEGHYAAGAGAYLMVFFAIWWAWMNFTWFATSFDTDDWLYRVMTIVQMIGVLIVAAGAKNAMVDADFLLVIIGYIIMRVALIGQWLRAAAGDSVLRKTALRYAGAIAAVQCLWVAWLSVPAPFQITAFILLALAEVAVPVWAERKHTTPWNPEHIAERFGLFVLILLGESILASTNAVVDAIEHAEHTAPLIQLALCGVVLAAGMWWVYFSREHDRHFGSMASALRFGYGHYLIFAAAGAFSAGIEVVIDNNAQTIGAAAASAAATLTIPVAIFLFGTWVLVLRPWLSKSQNAALPVLIVALGLSAFLPSALIIAALLMVTIVVIIERGREKQIIPALPNP